jgi:hypothetical protein
MSIELLTMHCKLFAHFLHRINSVVPWHIAFYTNPAGIRSRRKSLYSNTNSGNNYHLHLHHYHHHQYNIKAIA